MSIILVIFYPRSPFTVALPHLLLLYRLPVTIGTLKSLVVLDVSKNELRELPETLGRLDILEMLHVSDNHLREIPASLVNLKRLVSIDLSKNDWKPCNLEDLPLPEKILRTQFPGNTYFTRM